jgi:outer membrane protein TolC
MIETARKNRPETAQAIEREEVAAIRAAGTANGVLPGLQIRASASNTGQAGTAVPRQHPNAFFVGGAGTALEQVLQRNFPNENASLSFSARTRNSQALADTAIDELTLRQSQLARQKSSIDMARDIAIQRLALEQAAARFRSAQESRRLVELLLQAEEKKWQAGTSTLAAVVMARRELADAESGELAAMAALVRGRIALDAALGLTLERNGIRIEDVVQGTPAGN